MINHLMGFLRPQSTRSAIASSLVSIAASKIAAKSTIAFTLAAGLMYLPQNQAANTLTEFLLSFMDRPAPVAVAKKPATPVKIASRKNPNDKVMYMHSFKKQYIYVFSGKVTCGGEPCRTAALQLNIASKENPHIVRTITPAEDGSYEISVALKEYLNEHVDWWIVADSPDSASKQFQGRNILTDDATVKIEEPIQLL